MISYWNGIKVRSKHLQFGVRTLPERCWVSEHHRHSILAMSRVREHACKWKPYILFYVMCLYYQLIVPQVRSKGWLNMYCTAGLIWLWFGFLFYRSSFDLPISDALFHNHFSRWAHPANRTPFIWEILISKSWWRKVLKLIWLGWVAKASVSLGGTRGPLLAREPSNRAYNIEPVSALIGVRFEEFNKVEKESEKSIQ
jgi:hypothetical protein